MVWNNLTFMDNATTLSVIVGGVNDMTGGWLIGGIMLVLFVVSLFVFYGRTGIGEILLADGFFFSIIGLLFIKMGMLPTWVIGITIAIAVFGLLSIFMSN